MADNPLVDCNLTLFNKFGERYEAGKMSTYIKTASKLRLRWEAPTKMENISPFTHALLYRGKRVLKLTEFKGFEPGAFPKEIELEFAL